jgi:hypothetical protein
MSIQWPTAVVAVAFIVAMAVVAVLVPTSTAVVLATIGTVGTAVCAFMEKALTSRKKK